MALRRYTNLAMRDPTFLARFVLHQRTRCSGLRRSPVSQTIQAAVAGWLWPPLVVDARFDLQRVCAEAMYHLVVEAPFTEDGDGAGEDVGDAGRIPFNALHHIAIRRTWCRRRR